MGGRVATVTASGRRRLLVVVNPVASSVTARLRSLMTSALAARFEVEAEVTDGPGHAEQLAREAAACGTDAVVTFGGDGTANEAANGLIGSNVPLTCLPGGSANVFCGVMGIPRDAAGAVRHLLGKADSWRIREVDAASVNGRRFLFTSGVGLDAAVVAGVDSRPDLKRRWRQWWFVTEATRKLAGEYRFTPPRARLEVAEGNGASTRLEGIAVVVQNGRPWTYFGHRPVTVSPAAGLETGEITATVVSQPRPWDYPSIAWRVLSGRGADGHPRMHTVSAAEFSVFPADGDLIDVHVDGDHIGRFDRADYRVDAGALKVLG